MEKKHKPRVYDFLQGAGDSRKGPLKRYLLGSNTGRPTDHTYGGMYIEMC